MTGGGGAERHAHFHPFRVGDYGMTEVPMICVASPQDSAEQLAETEGRPILGNQVRIADGTRCCRQARTARSR